MIGENKEKGSIDWIERIALSFALSIAVVPLAVFYLNLIGVKINLLNSFLIILGIIVVSSIIFVWRLRKLRKEKPRHPLCFIIPFYTHKKQQNI